jgi:hypothetical protein
MEEGIGISLELYSKELGEIGEGVAGEDIGIYTGYGNLSPAAQRPFSRVNRMTRLLETNQILLRADTAKGVTAGKNMAQLDMEIGAGISASR